MAADETRIDEIVDGIYRISTWQPLYGITFATRSRRPAKKLPIYIRMLLLTAAVLYVTHV